MGSGTRISNTEKDWKIVGHTFWWNRCDLGHTEQSDSGDLGRKQSIRAKQRVIHEWVAQNRVMGTTKVTS